MPVIISLPNFLEPEMIILVMACVQLCDVSLTCNVNVVSQKNLNQSLCLSEEFSSSLMLTSWLCMNPS